MVNRSWARNSRKGRFLRGSRSRGSRSATRVRYIRNTMVRRPSWVNNSQRAVSTRRQGIVRGHPFPQKLRTQLTVLERNGLASGVTAGQAIIYRPTSYFDFDPAVGGQTFGGYGVLANIYDRYRVLAFRYIITFINLEAYSVTVTTEAIADTSTPGSGTTVDYTEFAIEAANYARSTQLAPNGSGGSMKTLSMLVKTRSVWGTPEVFTDAAYAANAGANPAANTWLRVAAYMNNGQPLAIGVQFTMKLTSYGYWDEKNDLIS